jgi:hypothetical protein
MSFCAASCFICCHPVSCASVTSDSSPTAIALRFCHYAANFSAAQKRYLLRQHHRPPTEPLTLELSCLRRSHARRRTALRRATPAPLATSTRPVRSMKVYSHPRPLFALRRARGFFASSGQNPSDPSLSRLYIGHRRTAAPRHPAARPPDPAQLGLSLIPLHPFRPIQST